MALPDAESAEAHRRDEQVGMTELIRNDISLFEFRCHSPSLLVRGIGWPNDRKARVGKRIAELQPPRSEPLSCRRPPQKARSSCLRAREQRVGRLFGLVFWFVCFHGYCFFPFHVEVTFVLYLEFLLSLGSD